MYHNFSFRSQVISFIPFSSSHFAFFFVICLFDLSVWHVLVYGGGACPMFIRPKSVWCQLGTFQFSPGFMSAVSIFMHTASRFVPISVCKSWSEPDISSGHRTDFAHRTRAASLVYMAFSFTWGSTKWLWWVGSWVILNLGGFNFYPKSMSWPVQIEW